MAEEKGITARVAAAPCLAHKWVDSLEEEIGWVASWWVASCWAKAAEEAIPLIFAQSRHYLFCPPPLLYTHKLLLV
jgi:hypothetical protein